MRTTYRLSAPVTSARGRELSALKGAGQGGPAPEWSIAHKREAAGCRRCCAIPAARRAALKQAGHRPDFIRQAGRMPASIWRVRTTKCEPQDAASGGRAAGGPAGHGVLEQRSAAGSRAIYSVGLSIGRKGTDLFSGCDGAPGTKRQEIYCFRWRGRPGPRSSMRCPMRRSTSSASKNRSVPFLPLRAAAGRRPRFVICLSAPDGPPGRHLWGRKGTDLFSG